MAHTFTCSQYLHCKCKSKSNIQFTPHLTLHKTLSIFMYVVVSILVYGACVSMSMCMCMRQLNTVSIFSAIHGWLFIPYSPKHQYKNSVVLSTDQYWFRWPNFHQIIDWIWMDFGTSMHWMKHFERIGKGIFEKTQIWSIDSIKLNSNTTNNTTSIFQNAFFMYLSRSFCVC